MRRLALSFAALGILALIACSSSDNGPHKLSGTPTTATPADANAYCAAFCNWKSKCGLNAPADAGPDCKSACTKDAEPRRVVSRAAFFQNVAYCFSTLDCTHFASTCADNLSLGDPAFPNIPEVQDCLKKYETCGGELSDEKCNSIAVLTNDHRTQAEACLSNQDCTAADKCLAAAGAFDQQQ